MQKKKKTTSKLVRSKFTFSSKPEKLFGLHVAYFALLKYPFIQSCAVSKNYGDNNGIVKSLVSQYAVTVLLCVSLVIKSEAFVAVSRGKH